MIKIAELYRQYFVLKKAQCISFLKKYVWKTESLHQVTYNNFITINNWIKNKSNFSTLIIILLMSRLFWKPASSLQEATFGSCKFLLYPILANSCYAYFSLVRCVASLNYWPGFPLKCVLRYANCKVMIYKGKRIL